MIECIAMWYLVLVAILCVGDWSVVGFDVALHGVNSADAAAAAAAADRSNGAGVSAVVA